MTLLTDQYDKCKISLLNASNFRKAIYRDFCFLSVVNFFIANARFDLVELSGKISEFYDGLIASEHCIENCAETWGEQKTCLIEIVRQSATLGQLQRALDLETRNLKISNAQLLRVIVMAGNAYQASMPAKLYIKN